MLETITTTLSSGLNAFKLKDAIAKIGDQRRGAKTRKAYGARVKELRKQVGDALAWSAWPPDHCDGISREYFADMLGFDDLTTASEIEDGRRPPSTADIDRIAQRTGASRRHLLDGSESLWTPRCEEVISPLEALPLLDDEVVGIIGVRVDAPDGGVALIVDRGDWRSASVIHLSCFHFGSEVGGGGRRAQLDLFFLRGALDPDFLVPAPCAGTVEKVRKEATFTRTDVNLYGRIAPREDFDRLACGDLHPYAFLNCGQFRNDHWFADFADVLGESPVADAYAKKFGENFIEVQRNVRYQLKIGEYKNV